MKTPDNLTRAASKAWLEVARGCRARRRRADIKGVRTASGMALSRGFAVKVAEEYDDA